MAPGDGLRQQSTDGRAVPGAVPGAPVRVHDLAAPLDWLPGQCMDAGLFALALEYVTTGWRLGERHRVAEAGRHAGSRRVGRRGTRLRRADIPRLRTTDRTVRESGRNRPNGGHLG